MNSPTPTFSGELRTAADPIWQRQLTHPFLLGLADGSLPPARFLFYTQQDAVFLREMNRVFGYAAARADTGPDMARFAGLLAETEEILVRLHVRYAAGPGGHPGADATSLTATPPAAITYAYSRHLLWTALADNYLAIITALLPSMWMYDELGRHLAARGHPPADHPYHHWLEVHAGPHLNTITAWLRGLLDSRAPALGAAEQAHLRDVFLTSSRYEILFWDMAWREEMWPV